MFAWFTCFLCFLENKFLITLWWQLRVSNFLMTATLYISFCWICSLSFVFNVLGCSFKVR